MSRGTWGGVMVASLLASGGSGYYLFTQKDLSALTAVPPVPVAPAPAPPAPAPAPPKQIIPEKAAIAPTTRNILFRFPKPSAKSVFIIGDFNDWKRQPMEKKAKGWEMSLPLEPGSYKYMFVVDEKRVKDPNNKTVRDGRSVINVKPLTS